MILDERHIKLLDQTTTAQSIVSRMMKKLTLEDNEKSTLGEGIVNTALFGICNSVVYMSNSIRPLYVIPHDANALHT
jgi:hypothetical protein